MIIITGVLMFLCFFKDETLFLKKVLKYWKRLKSFQRFRDIGNLKHYDDQSQLCKNLPHKLTDE